MSARPAADTGVADTAAVTVGAVLLIAAAATALLWPTIRSLMLQWADTDNHTYTHGYIIAALCVGLLVRTARGSLESIVPDWRMLVPLALFSFAWLMAWRAGIELAHQLLFPLLAFFATCAALGLRNGRRFAFAFGFLYFAISIWDAGNGLLQSVATRAVKLMLQISSVPAYVEGSLVNIPAGVFVIEGGCSGLHYFIVALAIAALYGELHRDPWKLRVRQMLLAAALAVICNWIRIYVVVVAGHLSDMQHYLVRVEHYYFGWLLFALTMGLFFWLVSRSAAHTTRPVDTAHPSVDFRRLAPALAGSLAALAVGPVLGAIAPVRTSQPAQLPLLPDSLALWSGSATLAGSWSPSYPQADRTSLHSYSRQGHRVAVFVAEYDEQRQGKELVGYGNSLLTGLEEVVDGRRMVESARGPVSELQLTAPGGEKSVIAFFYQVGSTRIVSGLSAQLRYAAQTFAGPVRSRVVAAYAPCDSDCAAAAAQARELLDDLDANQALATR